MVAPQLLKRTVALIAWIGVVFAAHPAHAQSLTFFKNYFVTGDYATAGVGLDKTGTAGRVSGVVNISDPNVPDVGAEALAAFLYWQVISSTGPDAGSLGAKFNGQLLSSPIGLPTPDGPLAVVGSPAGTQSCPLTGGGGGNRVYAYRADVLRFLDVVDGRHRIEGDYLIELPDGGGNSQMPRAIGASLVVIYKHPSPAWPLNAIVMYDGNFTKLSSQTMTQSIQGYYDAAAVPGKMTHIAGSAQSSLSERLRVPGGVLDNAFRSAQGASWDNLTVQTATPAGASFVTSVEPRGLISDCLTWGAIVYRTQVKDADVDGLLDQWESSATPLVDPNGDLLPNLSLMGANPNRKDIFIEIGSMTNGASLYGGISKKEHSHFPTYAALEMVGNAFRDAPVSNPDGSTGISLHVDVGGNYQDLGNYIIPTLQARGGEAVNEMDTVCPLDSLDPARPWVCQFNAYPGTVGWKSGFRFFRDMPKELSDDECEANEADGNPLTTCERIFDRNRKDMFRYVLFAHALGVPREDCLVDGFPDETCQASDLFHEPVTNTGAGDFGGGDAMVTLGGFDDAEGRPVGSDYMQAATLMHELGHSFFLRHGGASGEPNCKPNYQSVMNYLFQLRGLKDTLNISRVNFSGQSLPGQDETSLSDPGGLGVDLSTNEPPPYRTGWYAPKESGVIGTAATQHCDGSPLSTAEEFDRLDGRGMVRIDSTSVAATQGAIDWTKSPAQPASGGQDINLDGTKNTLNQGYNDWANIRLNQVGSRRNVGGWFWVFDALTNDYLAFMGTLSLHVGRADLGRADLGRADLGRADLGAGDFGRGDTGFGDLGRADLGRADLGRADLGRADLGRADLGRADLGAGSGPPGELNVLIVSASGGATPEQLSARVLGFENTCSGLLPAVCHRIQLDWKRSNLGSETGYRIFRASGAGSPQVIGQVLSVTGQVDYSFVDLEELPNGPFTYTVLAFTVLAGPPGESGAASEVEITAINTPPAAVTNAYSTNAGVALVVVTTGVLGNDSDIDSPSLGAVRVTAPQFGTLSVNLNGSFTYTPNAGYAGPDSFTYTANDVDPSRSSNVVTVSITVILVNHPPAGTDKTVTTKKNKSYVLKTADFGFSDPNDNPPHAFSKVKITTLPSSTIGTLKLHGTAIAANTFVTVTDCAAGKLIFVPKSNKTGTATFTFQVQDNGGTANGGVDLDPSPNTLKVKVSGDD